MLNSNKMYLKSSNNNKKKLPCFVRHISLNKIAMESIVSRAWNWSVLRVKSSIINSLDQYYFYLHIQKTNKIEHFKPLIKIFRYISNNSSTSAHYLLINWWNLNLIIFYTYFVKLNGTGFILLYAYIHI